MHMFWWFGSDLGTFLIPGYVVSSSGAFAAACLGLTALAILFEAMKPFQIKLHRMTKTSLPPKDDSRSELSGLLAHIIPRFPTLPRQSRCWILGQWILEVLHYSSHNTIGYILMLSVMTYNAYICIALIVGSTIGYWIFSPLLLELNMSDLRRKYNVISCETECADSVVNNQSCQSTVSTIADQAAVSEINADVHTAGST